MPAVDDHVARVHDFAFPQLEEQAPEFIVADARDVGGARPAARRGDDHVRRVPAEPLRESALRVASG